MDKTLKQVNISLTQDLYKRMTELMIKSQQLNRSAYIRSLIERAWAEQQGE